MKELRDYQKKLAQAIIDNKKLLLAVDMGLGKTVSCLTAIEKLLKTNNISKVLIVAPLRVAHTTWPEEIDQWDHLKDIKYTVIKGTKEQRMKNLKEDSFIYIINRENIVWLYENVDFSFDCIVWDESSSLKGAKHKTKKGELSRYGALCKMSVQAPRVTLLSGTPTPNGLEDIYGQITALNPTSNLLEASKYKFLNKYFRDVSRVKTYQIWKPMPGSYQTVMKLCENYIIKMKSEDYLTLPDFIPINIELNLDIKIAANYKQLKSNLILNNDIRAKTPAILVNKLLQLSTGCVYKEDGTYDIFHTLKIEALQDIIEENNSENIIVFYNYKHEKEQLKKAFKDIRFLTTDKDISDWNKGSIKLLACHPASAGHGLNLQHGGSVMVWLSLPWSLDLYQQANKRLHRSGQLMPVRCYHLLMRKTVEIDVLDVLQGKCEVQSFLTNLMKELT